MTEQQAIELLDILVGIGQQLEGIRKALEDRPAGIVPAPDSGKEGFGTMKGGGWAPLP